MAQSNEFVDASHALNDLSHALALLESENASLRGAVDGLCNENAKLREELEAVGTAAYLYGRDDLKAENAKLRELLSSYWKRVHSPAAPNVERDYLAEMRELEVEVDE